MQYVWSGARSRWRSSQDEWMKPPKPLIMGPGHGGVHGGYRGGTWGAWGCSTQEVWWRWAISRVSQSYSRCLAVSGGVTLLQGRLNPLTKENHTKKHKCYNFEMRQTKQDKYRVSVQKGNTRGFTVVKLHRFSVYFVIHPCTSQSIFLSQTSPLPKPCLAVYRPAI